MTRPAPYPDFDGTQACAGRDTDEFFVGDHGDRSHDVARIRAAVAICSGCSFREPCLAYALTHVERGIWGGTTAATRQAIQKKHGIKPHQLELPDRFPQGETA